MTSASRILGVLPAIRGSLSDLDRHGQVARFVDWYLPAYLRRFERVRFFSYEPERIDQFATDAEVRRRVEVVAPSESRGRAYAIWLGTVGRSLLRECDVVRVLQAPGAVPTLLARAPYVCTYGYDYVGLASAGGPRRVEATLRVAKRHALGLTLRLILQASAATIVTSREGREVAVSLGAKRVQVVRNGIDIGTFEPQHVEPLHDILFVGRLAPEKDIPTLLRAVAMFEPRPKLVVVGEGPGYGSLAALARDLGVDVDFRGRVPNSEVAALLGRTRCLVLPSTIEGQPKVLLEAMACGVASIASDIPAHRDLADFGGIRLFRRGNPNDLAAVIAQVVGDAETRKELGAAGRLAAEENFDISALLDEELDLLCEVAGQNSETDVR